MCNDVTMLCIIMNNRTALNNTVYQNLSKQKDNVYRFQNNQLVADKTYRNRISTVDIGESWSSDTHPSMKLKRKSF